MQPRSWSRAWKGATFIRRLSGLTLAPSRRDDLADVFIASLPAIPASPTALPESGAVPAMTASLSTRFCVSWMKAGLILSSAKTSRGMQTDSLPPSARHWRQWASALRQEYSVRAKPATAIGGNGCSFWPGVRVAAGGYTRDRGNPDAPRPTLEGLAAVWLTPNVPNGGRTAHHAEIQGATAYHKGKKVQLGLEHQASQWATQSDLSKRGGSQTAEKRRAGGHAVNIEDQAEYWTTPSCSDPHRGGVITEAMTGTSLTQQVNAWPSPMARDYRGGGNALTRADGKTRLDMLDWAAEAWTSPRSSSPDLPAQTGPDCSPSAPNSRQRSERKRLNVYFVEALMRWPIGWTDCGCAETGLTRWLPPMRGFVSALCLMREETREQGVLL